MKTTTLLIVLLTVWISWTAGSVKAQTYFYLGQIAVVPVAPTDQDQVQLQLIGNLSSTGSSITSASADVNGYTVNVALLTENTTGLTVIVPHTEPVDLGLLAAGTYTVNVTGFGVQDLALSDQHVFTVSGSASACDSLIFASLTWAPFSDTGLLVHVYNQSSMLFDYPGFLLLADNGDTLAQETVNFFGIAGESYHTLTIPSGTNMPSSPFNGTLQLWTLFYDTLACTWDLPVDLCPPESCTEVILDMQNFGSGLATGSYLYTVREAGLTVATGTFILTDEQQYDQDTICLPPGNYLMELIPQQGPTGGQSSFGVGMGYAVPGPRAPVTWTTPSVVAFNFYSPCIEVAQSVPEVMDARLVVSAVSGLSTLFRTDGRALDELRVIDAQGRLVLALSERTARLQFSTDGWARGMYFLEARNADGHVLTARMIVE